MSPRRIAVLAAAVGLALAGCERDAALQAPDLGPPLAEVAGAPIHEVDLEVHLNKLFGDAGTAADPDVRRKALESLVMARVIAQAAEPELSAEARARVEAQVTLYREQLLVNEYLRQHVTPEPVSAEMVESYYRQHPERFGGGPVRTFEMIMAAEPPVAPQRDAMLQALRQAGKEGDWAKRVERLRGQGLSLEYRQGSGNDPVLPEALRSVVAGLAVAQASEPGLLQRRPYIVRVVSEAQREPRPLAEVSAEIRRSLAPVQLKEAVRELSEPLMQKANVKYFEAGDDKP